MNNLMNHTPVYFLQVAQEASATDEEHAVATDATVDEHQAQTTESAHQGGHAEAPKDLITQLNETNTVAFFLVIVFFMWVFSQFKLTQKIADSRQGIEDEIKSIESEKDKALAELESIKERTANLQHEVETIITDAEKAAHNLSEKILEDANEQVGKIVETAKKRIEIEQKSVAASLEKRLLSDALADAREELVNNMTPKDQQRSIEVFLEQMAASQN